MIPTVLKWFTKNYHSSCAIEIKSTTKNTIPEKSLAPHQKLALLAAKGVGITHKIADSGVRLPFDAFYLTGSDAVVVACFTHYGKCLVFDVEDWKGAKYDDEVKYIIKL